jgi:hypothetical protein
LWIDFSPVKRLMRWVMVWVIGMWKWRVLRWGSCDGGGRPRGVVVGGK